MSQRLTPERFEVLAHLVEVAGLSDSCEAFDVDREQAEGELITALKQGAKAEAEMDRLEAALDTLALAVTPNHVGHWDRTGGSGSGCPECQRIQAAKDEARAVLADMKGDR